MNLPHYPPTLRELRALVVIDVTDGPPSPEQIICATSRQRVISEGIALVLLRQHGHGDYRWLPASAARPWWP